MSELKARILGAIGWSIWTIVFTFGFITFGYTYGNVAAPSDFPIWLWNLVFCTMILSCFVLTMYGVFGILDNLFLKRNDTRRITRPVTIRWGE